MCTSFTINFGAINFGEKNFGEINFGEISAIQRIATEIRSLKNFGVKKFRLGTEIYRKCERALEYIILRD